MLGLLLTLLLATGSALYDDPAADSLIRKAMEATYDMRLDEARAAALALEERYPEHPAGYLIMAETYWWQAQADPESQSVEDAYHRAQQLAQKKAEDALKAGKYSTAEILAYLASAHGSKARFQVTQHGVSLGAARTGKRAYNFAKQVYELDHDYYDMYVGLGAFNFFTGSLPGILKPFAWIFGARGDRDAGEQQLLTAMNKGRYSKVEARIVFFTAMVQDKQFGRALTILEKLMSDYPDNHVFYTWVTDWHRQQKKNLEGAEYFERVYERQIRRSPTLAQYALIEKATLQLAHGRKAEAAQTVARIKAIPAADSLISTKVLILERRIARG